MKLVALPEVAAIIMGQSPPSSYYNTRGEGLPFFQGKADFGDLYPTVRMFCTEPSKVAEAGDVLISVRAPVGPTNISPAKCCIGRGLAAIRCSKAIESKYLLYFLRFYEPELVRVSSGSTFDAISRDDLENIRVPLPPLPEQQRIAAILAKADRLRRLRRTARDISDTYLQSVFLEMFGDPVSNPMGWGVAKLKSQIRHIDSGWSPVCGETRTSDEQWAVLRLGAVTSGIYLPDENKQLLPGSEPRPDLEVKKGDVLITRKNTVDLVAACAFVHHTPPKLMLPDTIFRFVFREDSQVRSEYLWGLFSEKAFRKKVQSLATGTAGSMPNISKEKLLGVEILLPPVPLQQQFAHIVHQFERLRAQQREAERQAEHLFQTLLDRAFRGEV